MKKTEKELRRGLSLLSAWKEVNVHIQTLNRINIEKDDEQLPEGIPPDVLNWVDRKPAAKGLLSLLIERSAELRKQAEELEVDLG